MQTSILDSNPPANLADEGVFANPADNNNIILPELKKGVDREK